MTERDLELPLYKAETLILKLYLGNLAEIVFEMYKTSRNDTNCQKFGF